MSIILRFDFYFHFDCCCGFFLSWRIVIFVVALNKLVLQFFISIIIKRHHYMEKRFGSCSSVPGHKKKLLVKKFWSTHSRNLIFVTIRIFFVIFSCFLCARSWKKRCFFLSHRNFVIGGNLLQGFRSFHKQSRPGPLNVQRIQELLAEKIEK